MNLKKNNYNNQIGWKFQQSFWTEMSTIIFEQRYQQSIWTKKSATNSNKNIHNEFEQIYQQSIWTEILTINPEQKYQQSTLKNLSTIIFEQKN